MHCVKKITDDMYWIGASDRRLALFENVYPIPDGVSYNSYVLTDDKTVVFDTVDSAVSARFFENLEYVLDGRTLDYLVVNHMEPDHCASMAELAARYPEVKIVGNAKTINMIKQFFTFDVNSRSVIVKEGDTLTTGKHTLTFVMAPMVHWPEVMVTYDTTDKVLYSADAFGTFGALNGNIFADEVDFENTCLDEARRYYTNIVGKYGTQVQALLKKAAGLEIKVLCPLHGPVWRANIDWFVEKYMRWSTYTPEDNAVMIAYGSVYGGTENAADILALELAERGVKNIKVYDVSKTHPSVIVSEAFRCSHLVFASSTYNAGIFTPMETVLLDIAAHNLQNRTVALIENGTWAATSGKQMAAILEPLKNTTILDKVSIKSTVADTAPIAALADTIATSIAEKNTAQKSDIESGAMFALSYGLYVLTAREGDKDNGCIINTAVQITSNPNRISIAVNKANYTHDMIKRTGVFNISVLTEDAPFDVFKRFGFASGRDTDKFEGCECGTRSANGLMYVGKHTNAFMSCKVVETRDYGSHTLFIADVTEAKRLSDAPSVTYTYYHANIRPKPEAAAEKKKGYVCKICGYVYEGDTLPDDFVCPICKHGAEDFEPIN